MTFPLLLSYNSFHRLTRQNQASDVKQRCDAVSSGSATEFISVRDWRLRQMDDPLQVSSLDTRFWSRRRVSWTSSMGEDREVRKLSAVERVGLRLLRLRNFYPPLGWHRLKIAQHLLSSSSSLLSDIIIKIITIWTSEYSEMIFCCILIHHL